MRAGVLCKVSSKRLTLEQVVDCFDYVQQRVRHVDYTINADKLENATGMTVQTLRQKAR